MQEPKHRYKTGGTQAHYLMHEDVVAVCSPDLIYRNFPELKPVSGPFQGTLSVKQIASLPLLQQTTRPYIWKEWFEVAGADYPYAMEGQRHELFSMLAVAASHHMGVALIPQMLLEKNSVRVSWLLLLILNSKVPDPIILYIPSSSLTH